MKPPADSEEPPEEEEKPDDSTEPSEEEEKPDDGTEPPAEGEEKPDDSTEPPTEEEKQPDDGTEPPAEEEKQPDDSTEPTTEEEKPDDGTETPGEDDNTDSVTEASEESSVTEFGDSGNENTAISTDDEVPASSDTADNTAAVGFRIETGSFVMPVYAAKNPQDGVNAGTLTDSTDETTAAPADDTAAQTDTDTNPREQNVNIENVTWQSDPSYDGDTEGVYTFTPVLPEGYVLAEGASLPQITVTVDGTAALIQALLERIAALPDVEEYMAKEPDIDKWEGDEDDYEEAYTEWMEGLQEYAGEALAIWEEYEALTQEQQALFPQEALDKLTAWVEIAETLSENTMVMAAADHMHDDISFDRWYFGADGYDSLNKPPKQSGDYYLHQDINVTLEKDYNAQLTDKTLNLCLNGKMVSCSWTYTPIYSLQAKPASLSDGSTLSIYDCSREGELHSSSYSVIRVNAGTLNLYNGKIVCDGGSEAAVNLRPLAQTPKANVYGGSIIGGMKVEGGLVSVSGGQITRANGHGIVVEQGKLTISGGTIETGASDCYAVYATDGRVIIAGDANLNTAIRTKKSIEAEGAGVSGLSTTYRIVYANVKDGDVVVKGSTDREHYQLVSDDFGLAAKDGNLIAAGKYKVTYNKNNGIIAEEDKYTSYVYDVGLTLPTPERVGYTFGGWYDNSGCTGTAVTSISPTATGNKTYYAKWTANKYTITYEGLTGATLSTKPTEHTYGAATSVGNPTKTGYTFEGWQVNNGSTVSKSLKLSATGYTADITLTATWTAHTYTVAYDGNGSTGGSTASSSHTYGISQNLTANGYTRSHTVTFNHNYTGSTGEKKTATYTFKGWNTKADGSGTSYNDKASVSNLTDTNGGTVTLYAKWTSKSVTCTPSRTGYTFGGWYTASNCTGSRVDSSGTYTPTATITLYAKWTRNTYTINYTLGGGALPSGKTNPASYTVESSAFTLNNPERTGYTFAGWSGTGLTGSTNKNVTIAKGSTGDREFTANWTRNTYTINYTLNGGALPSGKTNPTSYTVESDAFALNNPERTGYTFAGWSGTGLTGSTNKNVTIAKGSTGDRSYTANWTANKYTVTFAYQGATGGNGTTSKDVTYNGTYGELPTPTRTGYAFMGWYTQTGGQGSKITSTTTVNITAAQTLYAHWKDAVPPSVPTLQDGATLPTEWTNTRVTIPLTLSDNVGVTELWVNVDNKGYTQVSGFSGGTTYSYAVTEGDHTYRFQAKDAAGNISLDSEAFTVRLDTGAPSFSEDPAAKNVTSDSADITFTPSEGGKAYWIIDPAGTPADAQAVISGAQGSTDKGGVNVVTGGTSAVIPITGLTPGAAHKVYVVLEDAAGNLSVVKEAAFGTLPEAPVITLDDLIKDYEKEKIKVPDEFGEVEVYTDPDNLPIEPDDEGFLHVEPGKPIYIRYPEKTEDGVTVTPSESVRIDIPGRPDAPAPKQVTVTDTTVTVADPIAGEEYILVEKGSLPDWNDADKVNEAGEFTGLTPNKEYDLYVRKKATDDDFASEPAKTEVRTSVTIHEPEATGEGAGKPGNTAPKPEKPDEGGRTVTYTGTYGEEYTPVIKVGGKEIIPGAGTPDAGDSEMTWDEDSKEGEWKYVYPIPDGATETEITVEFRKRSITGLSVTPENLTLSADDDANRSAAEAGEITPSPRT